MDGRPDTDPEREAGLSPGPALPKEPPLAEDVVDETIAESFPASDPPQWWAGPPG
jgi:hypothetical protein